MRRDAAFDRAGFGRRVVVVFSRDGFGSDASDLAVIELQRRCFVLREAVDVGDFSTNEPTMDGTASLIYLLAAKENRKK